MLRAWAAGPAASGVVRLQSVVTCPESDTAFLTQHTPFPHVPCARAAARSVPSRTQERKREAILSANAERVRRLERERRNGKLGLLFWGCTDPPPRPPHAPSSSHSTPTTSGFAPKRSKRRCSHPPGPTRHDPQMLDVGCRASRSAVTDPVLPCFSRCITTHPLSPAHHPSSRTATLAQGTPFSS